MDKNGRDARLGLLARRQAGAFSFQQALEAGFPRTTISRRLAQGAWVRTHPGVYAINGAPATRMQELWAGALAVGPMAVLTHETSALIHGAERLPVHPIKLTVPHGWHHALDRIFVHQIDDLDDRHRTIWRGLPVSTPARTVVELAATQPAEELGRVLDDLVAARRVTYGQVFSVFGHVARPGKPGMEKLSRVLAERTGDHVPPSSELERLLFGVLAAGGLPAPRRQVQLSGRSGVIGVVDAAYPDARLVLEADGRRWHDRVATAADDRRRDAEAARVGWQTVRFMHEQLRDDPSEVCAIVEDTRAIRLARVRHAA